MRLRVDHTDSELLELLRTGDRAAFEAIYYRYAKFLFRLAGKNIPDHDDCEEIVQDAMVYLWEHRHELRIRNLESYLRGVVNHGITRRFYRLGLLEKYREHFRSFDIAYRHTPTFEDDPFVDEQILAREIVRLPERQKTALHLRFWQALSYNEIAARMNVTPRAVEAYLRRGLVGLRAFIEASGKTRA